MTVADLNSHKVGILGFGQEGQAVFAYLKKHGVSAVVFDENAELVSAANVIIRTGENYLDTITDCTLLFRSPGIWRNHPKIVEAEDNGIVITSQTKWFFENSPAKIIGVTGTKGKGTTSSLIYETLKASGKNSYLTGNIGKIQPLELLDNLTETDLVVYELSSFQLQDLTQSPYIGVCLMVTSDHLNHHSNLSEYHSAKTAITAFQTESDIAIFNVDYEASKKIGELGKGKKFMISAKDTIKQGASISNDIVTVNTHEENFKMDFSNRKLRGAHNLENIAASVLVCSSLGINRTIIEKVANDFSGLEHRLQFVRTFNGISFYNDSISTVPDTTLAAVKAFNEPIHLLLGGSNKGLSYEQLSKDLAQQKNICSISLLGETGEEIKHLLQQNALKINLFGPYGKLDLALKEIYRIAKVGDVVLLSPASASFDMFKNYADRGNQFSELVKQLK